MTGRLSNVTLKKRTKEIKVLSVYLGLTDEDEKSQKTTVKYTEQ